MTFRIGRGFAEVQILKTVKIQGSRKVESGPVSEIDDILICKYLNYLVTKSEKFSHLTLK